MSFSTPSTRSPSTLPGRPVTFAAIAVAGLGSALLNIYGASQMFPIWQTAAIFAVVIAACEVIAFLALPHIVQDWQNRRWEKAAIGGAIFVLAVTGCVISGKHAFSTLFLEADANHKALVIQADRLAERADSYHVAMLAGTLTDVTESQAVARWEFQQRAADEARLAEMKGKPPAPVIVFVFLALFEAVKIFGRFALATPTTLGPTRFQRLRTKQAEDLKMRQAEADHAAKLERLDDSDNVTPMRKGA